MPDYTKKGAQALGLTVQMLEEARVYLSGDADLQTEAYVDERVEQIALRGESVRFYNLRESARENAALARRTVVVLISMIVLFFTVSVSMITGGVTRRIRADRRMIGTLRAAGADARVITGCYSAQIALSVGLGFLLGLCLWGAMYFIPMFSFPASAVPLAAALLPVFAALCFAACFLIVKLRVREVTAKSIVDNIREL